MRLDLALIGFGTVARGLARLLLERADLLREAHGAEFRVTAIATARRGVWVDPRGVDLAAALDAGGGPLPGGGHADSLDVAREAPADVVLENTPTDLRTGGPALAHVRAALERGRHVVTANKGPIALAYRELSALARTRGAHLLFEGTVLSGTPILSLRRCGLGGARVLALRGILNGTTNYILAQMEAGMGYDDALRQAQALGYAEADPSADVEGWDAVAKLVILANVVLDGDLQVGDVAREGITGITAADVARAAAAGRRWKLIGEARREGGGVRAGVGPVEVPIEDPLAAVGAAMNALTFETDVLKSLTVTGAGAGGPQTGFALLSDLLELHRRLA